jgi:dipeptidyl aminopeptidase/acylaminoacyl peptidase
MKPSVLLTRCLLVVAAALQTPLVMAQAAAPLPVESFFRNPSLASPVLSPNGKQIAMAVPTQSGRMGVAVANVETPDKRVGVAQFEDADVRMVQWVNDQRLVFDLVDRNSPLEKQLGTGLYAVNADGTEYEWLIERTGNYRVTGTPAKRPLVWRNQFNRVLDDGSDDVLIVRWVPGMKYYTPVMARLNTKTLAIKNLDTGDAPDRAQRWLLDRKLQARGVTTWDGERTTTFYWRDEGSSDWTKIGSQDMYKPELADIDPVGIDHAGRLYVTAINPESKDGVTALYRYDTKKRQLDGPPVVSIPGFDFEGRLSYDATTQELLGVYYTQDADGVAWFNKAMSDSQAAIDKLLPNTINTISCRRCGSVKDYIVSAHSDIQSPIYFLFNRDTQKLKLVGAARPWLDSRQMAGTQDFLRIKARDGLELPTYITKPKGKGPWPTVVMVHGGPQVRGHQWGFNRTNQFLASRGYAVIETEFRLSKGYGTKLFKAGWKQWGLTMQDDVTDVTRWAIANNIADPKRIAIAGGSYGGYATMMGLVKEPELYKAGINIVGVTDIAMMYTIGWSDFLSADSSWVKYGMPEWIGDRVKDDDQFTRTSPLKRAKEIKQPVLMAYGGDDLRVPLPHGEKMKDALLASGNKDVEFVMYENEGHGFQLEKNNYDFWTRVEKFLARTLQ